MDIPREDLIKKRRRRRIIGIVATVALVGGALFGLSRLREAAPTVDRDTVWVDTVRRGTMIREVRGVGSLVPEDIRFITSRTTGRVEEILIRSGTEVTTGDRILELSNPELEQQLREAQLQLRAAEADRANLRVQLEGGILEARSAFAQLNARFQTAKLESEVNEELHAEGLVAELDLKRSRVNAEQLAIQVDLEEQRLAFRQEALKPQLAAQQAQVDQTAARYALVAEQVEALIVRATAAGVLQRLNLELGQQVNPGDTLAQVADPSRLKGVIRVPEIQAKDIVLGQPATVDTRNGVVEGRVARIDPAVESGTVAVDIALTGELPRGARADLTVEGTIVLDRLEDIIYVGRPYYGRDGSSISLFRLESNGASAVRIPVLFGRSSVNTIEVVQGLQPGDQVILSDTTQWNDHDRLNLN